MHNPPPKPIITHPIAALALTTALALTAQSCGVGYVLESAYYQMELLAARQPTEEVKANCDLTDTQRQSLELVSDVKRYGAQIGLAGSANYDTIAVGWDHKIWNISACDPLSFEARTWWFPIVGTVPYLGFFNEEDAREQEAALAAEGLDVFVRTAGAYSTLGWFEDPILTPMLSWGTYDLANTVLHELTHTTVWVPGSVAFNESFANFVGDVAALRYIEDRHGRQSALWTQTTALIEDRRRWVEVQKGVYADLEALYDSDLDDPTKLERKAQIFGSVPERVDALGFANADLYQRVARERVWNNALLIQFRAYNNNRQWFQALLDRHDGDLLAFMRAIEALADDADDPFEALERAATL